MASLTDSAKRPRRHLTPRTRHTINGILFASPWLLGLLMFWVYPTIASAYYSFTQFNAVQTPRWVGLANYRNLFTADDVFWMAVYNTLYFAVVSIPLAIIFAFGLALMLNAKIRGQVIYRTIYFLPTLVPEVALALVWVYLFTPGTGIVNLPFTWLGFRGPCWLTCTAWSRQTIVLLALWIIGQQIILYLAGLQDVPQDLYDAADVDGANAWRKFRNVTLPMLTPVIFFHLVTSVIGALQFFTVPFIMTGGTGFPGGTTMFYSIYLYKNAFQYFQMGYASAMAWLLFMVTLFITLIIFRSARLWVFYGGSN
ncbi:MAG: sugar ABC transporter permease [Caldilineaceae bacterium]|nr:sugar ABC transporter permease [Caldilineaceae bacterium]MCB0070658.1 sugar ABC transporter permease [Caldilineaceae bacterium]